MTRNKQSVGIDISKDSFTACLCTSQKDGSLQYKDRCKTNYSLMFKILSVFFVFFS